MLQAGIVGLPNVGKSTLFNAVTRTRKAEAANYPFCTIDPNIGVVTVPDERLDVLSKLSGSSKLIPQSSLSISPVSSRVPRPVPDSETNSSPTSAKSMPSFR